MATRIFFRGLGASSAYRALESHKGVEPMPTIAIAERFRNILRLVMFVTTFFGNPAIQSPGPPPAPELEQSFGRPAPCESRPASAWRAPGTASAWRRVPDRC